MTAASTHTTWARIRHRAAALGLLCVALFVVPAVILLLMPASALRRRRVLPDPSCDHSRRDALSVVIPNFDGSEILPACLESVRMAARQWSGAVEVIVVDDASTDDSRAVVRDQFPDVKLVANSVNLGFGGACNAGVARAQHPWVLLLNSDMRVAPDFIAPLMAGIEDPKVFATTSQVFFTDPGRRREETGLTYGRFRWGRAYLAHGDPGDEKRHQAVLWPGGGSALFCREKFLALGGFDPVFRPFYVEDLDLGIRAIRRGWRNVFVPQSRVDHLHRGTIGRLFSEPQIQGVMSKNLGTLALRHGSFLELLAWWGRALWDALVGVRNGEGTRSELPALRNVGNVLVYRRSQRAASFQGSLGELMNRFPRVLPPAPNELILRSGESPSPSPSPSPAFPSARLRLLFVSAYLPYPPDSGGAVRVSNILRRLAANHEVVLLSFYESSDEEAYFDTLRDTVSTFVPILRNGGAFRSNPFQSQSFFRDEFFKAEMEQAVDHWLRKVDAAQFEWTQMGQYRSEIDTPQVLVEHDLAFLSRARALRQRHRAARALPEWATWANDFTHEVAACARMDRVIVMSQHDGDVLARLMPDGPERIRVVPNGANVVECKATEPDGTVLFVGNFRHQPNTEAVLYFLESIWPEVYQRHHEARFLIAGPGAPAEVRAYQDRNGVQVLGRVEDLAAVYAQAAVAVAPILSGSGTRVKILEALGHGVPVVSTPLGCEGIVDPSGAAFRVAADPRSFGEQVLEILQSAETQQALSQRGQALVAARYTWDAAATENERVLIEAITRGT